MMSFYILDTDTLSLYQRGFPNVVLKVDGRNPSEMAITVITVEEEITGWYSLHRKVRGPNEQVRAYERLAPGDPAPRSLADHPHFPPSPHAVRDAHTNETQRAQDGSPNRRDRPGGRCGARVA